MNMPALSRKITLLAAALILCVACARPKVEPASPQTYAGASSTTQINDFIWRAMNDFYLWKDNVPALNDNEDDNADRYNALLSSQSSPKDFFNSLLYQRGTVDRFSFLNTDYVELENLLSGVSKTNGMIFGLSRIAEKSDVLIGVVRYVLPGSDAEAKGVKRGDLFTAINGTPLTINNYSALIAPDRYTVTFATEEKNLVKAEIKQDPIYVKKVFNGSNGRKVAYLMYNGFYDQYNKDLNAVFGEFKAQGADELILDLRYNGGGSVLAATYLASLIAGQSDGQVLFKQQWNDRWQKYFLDNNASLLSENFVSKMSDGTPLNSFTSLSRVYILTSDQTASASELIISGLSPYLNVVQIGTATYGKYTASITLYDSPSYRKRDINPGHRYALQPIVFKYANNLGETDFDKGLPPDIVKREGAGNMGVLGDPSEPLLATALRQISGQPILAYAPDQPEPIFINDITPPLALLYLPPEMLSK